MIGLARLFTRAIGSLVSQPVSEVSGHEDQLAAIGPLALCAKDWRNPFELDGEESADPDLPFHPEDWSGPLNNIEPEFMNGVEDF